MALQVPAHLLKYADKFATNEFDMPGSTPSYPQISVNKERFTAVDAEGNETLVSVTEMEFIVVGSNPNYSKIYYENAYDPENPSMPSCWSENNFSPDSRVGMPQAEFCHSCPKNQWGSAQSKMSGKGIKACTDVKKLAIYVWSDNVEGLFQFRISPASLQNWAKYMKELQTFPAGGARITPQMVWTRATWVPGKQNVMQFEMKDFVEEDWARMVDDYRDQREYELWIGADPQSQARRELTHAHATPARQLSYDDVMKRQEEWDRNHQLSQKVIDVEPEKPAAPTRKPRAPKAEAQPVDNTPAPSRRPAPGARAAVATGYPKADAQLAQAAEAAPRTAPATETPMQRAQRRAKEAIANGSSPGR